MRTSRILFGLCGALAIALASQVTYAGRCDGNQGNGKGNYCTPVTQPETPAQGETDREYTARVHTYAHGNSIAIQHLDKRQEATEATVVTHGNRLDGHDRELASHGNRLDGHDRELASQGKALGSTQKVVKAQGEVLDSHSDILASHGAAIHAQANYSVGNRAMISSLYDRANEHEARISSLERRMDELNEANAIALAVAGHQFNTQGGFQTAVSMSTMNGKQALAIGAGGAINERLFVNVGVAQSGSTSGGVVSSTLAW
ncbi:hypothetical protein [Pseudomonas phage ZQG1]|nr:hypothetical protein [Pseudomonas phage ZQG1]